MKTAMKVFLVLALFGSTAIADDGHMGNGGKNCPPGQTCLAGGNGDSAPVKGVSDTIFDWVEEYLGSIF